MPKAGGWINRYFERIKNNNVTDWKGTTDVCGSLSFLGEDHHIAIGVNRPSNGGESTPFRHGVIAVRSPKNKPLKVVPPGETEGRTEQKTLLLISYTMVLFESFFFVCVYYSNS